LLQSNGLCPALQIGQDNIDISAKLPQDLTAGAAWRGKFIGVGGDRYPAKSLRAGRDPFENRIAFRANR
jgi:hypothetical protein